jgi:hypothetical protein
MKGAEIPVTSRGCIRVHDGLGRRGQEIGGAGEADMVKVVEKGFDAAGSRSRGFADCLADANDLICHVAAG